MSIKQIEGYTVYMQHILGRGSYGNVYKGYSGENNQPVAVKIIPRDAIDSDPYLKMSLQNEIRIMQTVKSQNIVKFLDVMQSSKNYYIIQQLCDCDLSQIIKRGGCLTEEYCVDAITQICEGFLALVKQGIIHRDLKPANILKKGNSFKIADFGFSKQFFAKKEERNLDNQKNDNAGDIKMKTAVGTPLYMSIQILKSLNYTSKCDIWALGFIFYEMLHGETPWNAARQYQLVKNIQTIPLFIKRKDLSHQTVDFLKKCLQILEVNRISWNQIFVHPLFKGRFLGMADQNKQYENKMKGIMTKLRIYFHLNRDALENYLTKYGYKDTNEELSFENYYDLLKVANPETNMQEALYIFKKTDIDGNGAISLDEILMMLKKYGIEVEDPRLQKVDLSGSQGQIGEQRCKQVQSKLSKFFTRLHKMVEKHNLNLKRVFSDFDKGRRGYLHFAQFKEMTQKVLKQMSDEDAMMAFEMIDDNRSSTIDFQEFTRYYHLVNNTSPNDSK